MFQEQEQPPTRTEYTVEENELFNQFEKQLDDDVAPYLAGRERYGGFACTARRNVTFSKKGPIRDSFIDVTRWQYHWEDHDRSERVIGIHYDSKEKSFYTFLDSGEKHFLSMAGAIAEVQKKLAAMRAYFDKK